jgi:hypothetical protein
MWVTEENADKIKVNYEISRFYLGDGVRRWCQTPLSADQTTWQHVSLYLLLLLLLHSALQPLVGFGLLHDCVPQTFISTLLSPVSQFQLL